jgi:hypothetical protein
MAVLNWGKPKVQIGVVGLGNTPPTAWVTLPEIVQGTASMATEAGNKTEAIAEGGDVVDVRVDKSKYTFELELFVKKGDVKLIEDEDGIVTENYAVRLIPEDASTYAWIMDKCSVSCVESWTAADGSKWKYTFSGLKPAIGKILKKWVPLVVSTDMLAFTSAADTTGQIVTVTATGAVTATSSHTWATATVSGNDVTVTVTANVGAERTASINISADGKEMAVMVTQAAA